MNARPPHKWVVASTVMIGTIMAVLDSSVVNVSLPQMRGTLSATVEEITWVVTSYILANVLIMPAIGMLSARLGRKRFYIANIVLFTASSILCGMSRTLPAMVAFRALQGIGGGVLITISQAILRESFPPREQGLAMGLFGVGVVLAPAFGPTLGGWLTDHYSWPWVFFINVPIGIVNVLLAGRFIEDPPYLTREHGRLDWQGLAFMIIGLGALQLMLEKGESRDWFESAFIRALAVVAVVGLVAFVWRELSTERPAVDLRLLRNVSFASATAIGGALGIGLFGTLFLLPVFFQSLLGYPATTAGLALMPRSLAMVLFMPVAGRLYNRLGPRVLVGIGLLVSAWSFLDLAHLTTHIAAVHLIMPQVWQGVGFSFLFVALSTAALATMPRPNITAASGLYNVVRQVFGSVGIALSATQLSSGQVRFRALLSEHVTPFDPTTRQWLDQVAGAMRGAGADAGTASTRALALLNANVSGQAAVLAYNRVFILVAILFFLSVPLVLLLRAAPAAARADGSIE